jgi:hypothetical protein
MPLKIKAAGPLKFVCIERGAKPLNHVVGLFEVHAPHVHLTALKR